MFLNIYLTVYLLCTLITAIVSVYTFKLGMSVELETSKKAPLYFIFAMATNAIGSHIKSKVDSKLIELGPLDILQLSLFAWLVIIAIKKGPDFFDRHFLK